MRVLTRALVVTLTFNGCTDQEHLNIGRQVVSYRAKAEQHSRGTHDTFLSKVWHDHIHGHYGWVGEKMCL